MDRSVFSLRLAQLREKRGISAREMSLAIGQNAGYINNIETGKAFPSLVGFFYICEYLGISEQEFFDIENPDPNKLQELWKELRHLDGQQLDLILHLVKALGKK